MRSEHWRWSPAAVSVLIVWSGVLVAGPLNPPPGPIASTPGPEPRVAINATNTPGDADSLYKIVNPGSYYLTGNITGVAGKHGIEIAQVAVTLDLNGFTMFGAPGTLDGINVSGVTPHDIRIRNGVLQSWRNDGVDAFNSRAVRLEDLSIMLCVQTGIRVGIGAHVSGCRVDLCASGIDAGDESIIERCRVKQSLSGDGIGVGSFSTVTDCVSSLNAGIGLDIGGVSAVRGCISNDNTGIGFSTSDSSVVDCQAFDNGSHGFDDSSSTIERCLSRENGGSGFDLTSTILRHSKGSGNALHGIAATNTCIIIGNSCGTNGSAGTGAGIRVDQTRNRIEDNVCANNDRGIRCAGTQNFIARNLCQDNTVNWEVAEGNVCFVIQAVPAGAILGDFGGVSPGSTNPNANYTY